MKDFIERMKKEGRKLSVQGEFVVAEPAAGMKLADILEMQKLNKKGELAEYLKSNSN